MTAAVGIPKMVAVSDSRRYSQPQQTQRSQRKTFVSASSFPISQSPQHEDSLRLPPRRRQRLAVLRGGTAAQQPGGAGRLLLGRPVIRRGGRQEHRLDEQFHAPAPRPRGGGGLVGAV